MSAREAQRIAVGIEYDGYAYSGWQSQETARGIQSEVERALSFVADHPVEVTCAGRTDAGVHAIGQVAHFDTTSVRDLRSWVLGANTQLPPDISLTWARLVPRDFHARYSALRRSYRYVILNRPTRPALERHRVCWIHEALDETTMHEAGQVLTGEHDFTSFRGSECQARTPVRRLERLVVRRHDAIVTLEVTANAFLHDMVRNIAGSLIAVGKGERPGAWIAEVLGARDRRVAGITAPAGGLYLERVDYEPALGLPCGAPSAMIAAPTGAARPS
jgi:tRNA pseudouridine38-40 synthase